MSNNWPGTPDPEWPGTRDLPDAPWETGREREALPDAPWEQRAPRAGNPFDKFDHAGNPFDKFDPDAYLAAPQPQVGGGFDPDAFLKGSGRQHSALAACRTDVFVVRQPLWFGRSMLTWEA